VWSYWICDSFTGQKMERVFPLPGGQLRTVANGAGSGRHSFSLRDPETALPRSRWRQITTPWAYVLVACWNDVPLYAAFIMTARASKRDGILTITHNELRVIMRGRYQYNIYTHDQNGAFVVTGRSLPGVARAVIQRGLRNDPPGDWNLPVVLPADEAGGESRTWYAYRFESTEQMLAEIQDADGGPDIHFRPRWSAAGRLEWEARIGAPRLSGPTLELNAAAEDGGVFDLSETRDGTNQITGIWTQGEGSEVDMRIGRAGDTDGYTGTRIPNIDLPRPAKSLSDQRVLDSTARAHWRADREATQQFGISTLASTALAAGVVIGSTVRAWVQDDEYLEDGWKQGYLIGISAVAGDDEITLEIQ